MAIRSTLVLRGTETRSAPTRPAELPYPPGQREHWQVGVRYVVGRLTSPVVEQPVLPILDRIFPSRGRVGVLEMEVEPARFSRLSRAPSERRRGAVIAGRPVALNVPPKPAARLDSPPLRH
jgi:hypothetical protein